MKAALMAIIVLLLSVCMAAQTAPSQPPAAQEPAAAPSLNAILADLQRNALSTSGDIGKLRIEKWKTDNSEKQQMQQVADSLQRNITAAIPGLINDVQTSQGSISKTFKLYHNINVVYEFLSSLAEAAGAFGKKEEYDPLATDAATLDTIRQNLSAYIEQAANTMESHAKQPTASGSQAVQGKPRKIIIDDTAPTKKKTKKKAPSPQ